MRSLVIICAVILAGCQTTSQQVASNTQTRQFNDLERNCLSAGLKPDTIPFNECVRKSVEASKQPTAESRKQAKRIAIDDLGGDS